MKCIEHHTVAEMSQNIKRHFQLTPFHPKHYMSESGEDC